MVIDPVFQPFASEYIRENECRFDLFCPFPLKHCDSLGVIFIFWSNLNSTVRNNFPPIINQLVTFLYGVNFTGILILKSQHFLKKKDIYLH